MPGLSLNSNPPGPGMIKAGVAVSTTAFIVRKDFKPSSGGNDELGTTGALYVPSTTSPSVVL